MISAKSIIFMKVGYHCNETLEEILKRKRQEEIEAGFFWGYGGTLCHPRTQVQPFIQESLKRSFKTLLVLSFTPSKHSGLVRLAKEYSIDGKVWFPIPPGIEVRGSKYAIICKNLMQTDEKLDLNKYEVAIGRNRGKLLGEFIKSRVDKACAFFTFHPNNNPPNFVKVSYVAEVVEPYAVLLR